MSPAVPSFSTNSASARSVALAVAILSFIGILDASYLVAKHYLGGSVKCFFVEGCDVVTTSAYASVAGVPVALFGLFFYIVTLVFAFLYHETSNVRWWKVMALWSVGGLGATVWFLYVQAVILKAFCSYCLVSAVSSTLIFILVVWGLWSVYHQVDAGKN